MEVKYIDHMGSDLTCVNAARVSFNKTAEWKWCSGFEGQYCDDRCEIEGLTCPDLHDRDKKLINYLGQHGHWTPFGHPQISLHFKVPIFVARQIHKHQVGFVVNEVSRRYVSEEPEFYNPSIWRARSDNKKQGSDEREIYNMTSKTALWEELDAPFNFAKELFDESLALYKSMIDEGICPEQARMVLPLSTYTEFWMTGSLAAWARLYNLRIQPDAQKEVQEVARQIGEIVMPLFPVSWEALCQKHT